MPFLTDEEQKRPSWDPFAAWAERAKQTEVEPAAGPEPAASWGNGAYGRPSEVVDPGEQMDRLLRDQLGWMRHGIPPSRGHSPEQPGLGLVPFRD